MTNYYLRINDGIRNYKGEDYEPLCGDTLEEAVEDAKKFLKQEHSDFLWNDFNESVGYDETKISDIKTSHYEPSVVMDIVEVTRIADFDLASFAKEYIFAQKLEEKKETEDKESKERIQYEQLKKKFDKQ